MDSISLTEEEQQTAAAMDALLDDLSSKEGKVRAAALEQLAARAQELGAQHADALGAALPALVADSNVKAVCGACDLIARLCIDAPGVSVCVWR